MVPVMSLWLPILLSAVLAFVASSITHMVLKYHQTDFRKLPQEDEVMAALRPFAIPPGDYAMPYAGTPNEMKDREFLEKMRQGPVAMITVMKPGGPAMGKSLALWFLYCVVVSVFTAYVTGLAHGPGADYLAVFRVAGTTAFIGYALALWQDSIWHARAVSTTLKMTFDGLIFALLTAGAFGWLWPA